MNLYIIGPVTGIENDNRPEFERVRDELMGNCSIRRVDIPHEWTDVLVDQDLIDWKTAMSVSVSAMIQFIPVYERSEIVRQKSYKLLFDGIALLDGWENSRGAKIEHDLAEALGIPCKPWREWL